MKKKSVIVFMDAVDFQYELGEADGGNKVYCTLKDLMENNKCAKSCGVVRVKVSLVDWVMEQNWDNAKSVSYSIEDIKKNPDLQCLITAKGHLKYLEERVKKQKAKVAAYKAKIKGKKNAKL